MVVESRFFVPIPPTSLKNCPKACRRTPMPVQTNQPKAMPMKRKIDGESKEKERQSQDREGWEEPKKSDRLSAKS